MSYTTSNIMGRSMLVNLAGIRSVLSTASERLASGKKINRAADDPTGLYIAKKFEAHIRGLDESISGIQKSMDLTDVADKTIDTVQNTLKRMRDIAVRAQNTATLDAMSEYELFREFWMDANFMWDELNSANFNTKTLLTGQYFGGDPNDLDSAPDIQVGADPGQTIKLFLHDLRDILNSPSDKELPPGGSFQDLQDGSITQADLASFFGQQFGWLEDDIATAMDARANVGVLRERLDHVLEDLMAERLNSIDAKSHFEDTDMAADISDLKKGQVQLVSTNTMIKEQMQLDRDFAAEWVDSLKNVDNPDGGGFDVAI